MAFTFNGIGTKYYGEGDRRPDGSFVTTEWFTVLYVPLIPLRSFRFVRIAGKGVNLGVYSSSSYGVVEKLPVAWGQVGRVYLFTFGTVAWIWLTVWLLFDKLARQFASNDGVRVILMIALGAVPFVFLWYKRRSDYRAKYGDRPA